MIVFSLRLARPLYQTLVLLIGVYVIMFLPQILGPSRDSLGRVSPSMEEASRSLGRSPARTFMSVTLPLMAPGLLSGAALGVLDHPAGTPRHPALASGRFRDPGHPGLERHRGGVLHSGCIGRAASPVDRGSSLGHRDPP